MLDPLFVAVTVMVAGAFAAAMAIVRSLVPARLRPRRRFGRP